MADDAEKTEALYSLNEKRTSPFFYVSHYGTKVRSLYDFIEFF